VHTEIADLGIAEQLAKNLGVRTRGEQVAQCLLLVLVVGDDQGFPLAGHDGVSVPGLLSSRSHTCPAS